MTRLRSRRRNTTKISPTLDVNHYHCDISMMYNHYHCDHISMSKSSLWSYSSSSLPTHHSSKLSSEPIHCYVKYFKINSFHPGDFPKKHFSFNSKCQNSLLQCHSISISSPDCWTWPTCKLVPIVIFVSTGIFSLIFKNAFYQKF